VKLSYVFKVLDLGIVVDAMVIQTHIRGLYLSYLQSRERCMCSQTYNREPNAIISANTSITTAGLVNV